MTDHPIKSVPGKCLKFIQGSSEVVPLKCQASIAFVGHGTSFSHITGFHQTLAGSETQHRYMQNLGCLFVAGTNTRFRIWRAHVYLQTKVICTGTKVLRVYSGYRTLNQGSDSLVSKMVSVLAKTYSSTSIRVLKSMPKILLMPFFERSSHFGAMDSP